MSRTTVLSCVASLLLGTLAAACSGGGEGPSGPAGASGGGGPGTDDARAAGGGLGGGAGALATGGAASGEGPGTGGGGGPGSGGNAGGPTDGAVDGFVAPDAARGRDGTGGGTSSGGAGSGGALGGAGGTTVGGSVGRDAAPIADTGADTTASKDTVIADAYLIPDLPGRQDAPATFWAATYATNCTPAAYNSRTQSDGHHRPGENCMTSGCHLNPQKPEHHAGTDCRGSGCHSNGSPDGSGAPAFLFGGTAYRAGTLTAEASAEIGVLASDGFYLACSASNGNFWYMAPSGKTSLPWSGATARLRNANGQAPMMTAPAAGCNASNCHTKTLKITAP
jgi:hypothetical protein